MKVVKEFATGWGDTYPIQWSERVEEELTGTARGHLFIPLMRPFDHLAGPNETTTFLTSETSRFAVEALRGTQPCFHRNADFDELFFQWAGESVYETEYGVFKAMPQHLTLIPSGVSHRASGSADCLRMSIRLRDPIDVLIDERRHIGETDYRVSWSGAPEWPVPSGQAVATKGQVTESVHTWGDRDGEETLIERQYDRLVGVSTGGRSLHNIRLFDIFEKLTGGLGPGPVCMKNDSFLIECYNTPGEQAAFHRGNRNEEFQFQFAGTADNICEFGTARMQAGDLFIVRRGIGHRVVGSPNFRRLVIYSKDPWTVAIDPQQPRYKTTFSVEERVVEAAPWRSEPRP
ncbi:MAG: hypothetical protein WCS09_10370 [Pseudomonadota bacterium]